MQLATIGYGLMTLSLGSLATYGMVNVDELRSPFGSTHVFAPNAAAECQPTIILPPATEKSAAASTTIEASAAPEAVAPLAPQLAAGMTADDVIAIMGEPSAISLDGTHWTYGSNVLIFNDADTLAGHVAYDPVQAALNKYNHMIALVNSDDAEAPRNASARNAGPKVLTAKSSRFNLSRYGKNAYRPVRAGSARQAYRYDGNNNEYSYYMNRSGPMSRIFSRKSAMPRGMMSATDRNLGRYRSNSSMGGQAYRR